MKKLKCPAAFTLMIIISTIIFCPTTRAQKSSDSAAIQMTRVEMGNYYMKKSKNEKLWGTVLFGTGIATFVAAGVTSMDDSKATVPLFITSMITLAVGNPVLSAGAKSRGMAEMLFRQPAADESAEDVKELAGKYRTRAIIGSVTGWSLLIGGIAVLASVDSDAGAIVGLTSMFVSVPVWMIAAKNRGRVSILMEKETVPVSYKSTLSMPSIGINIPISR